jgi:hypothetical protein
MRSLKQLIFVVVGTVLLVAQTAMAQDAEFRLGIGIPLGTRQRGTSAGQCFARVNGGGGATSDSAANSGTSSPGQLFVQDRDSTRPRQARAVRTLIPVDRGNDRMYMRADPSGGRIGRRASRIYAVESAARAC